MVKKPVLKLEKFSNYFVGNCQKKNFFLPFTLKLPGNSKSNKFLVEKRKSFS